MQHHCRVTAGFYLPLNTLTACLLSQSRRLGGVGAQDVGVTGIEDGHGRAAEELTASSAELNLQITKSQSQIASLQSVPYEERLLLRALERVYIVCRLKVP